jgi:uncharacterized protein YecE (DUF72 family)
MRPSLHVGTAGWPLPRAERHRFPQVGTNLERYAARLPAVELNSTFYRPHRLATYARWAASVPAHFRFAVKVPRAITHEQRLVDAGPLLDAFVGEVEALGDRLGCLLVQLPPSLSCDPAITAAFLDEVRRRHGGAVAIEARHPSWFGEEPGRLMEEHGVARVAADPACVPAAADPGGSLDTVYFRLHGSPEMYRSRYDDSFLDVLARRIRAFGGRTRAVWCTFDNTMLGAATGNALGLLDRLV